MTEENPTTAAGDFLDDPCEVFDSPEFRNAVKELEDYVATLPEVKPYSPEIIEESERRLVKQLQGNTPSRARLAGKRHLMVAEISRRSGLPYMIVNEMLSLGWVYEEYADGPSKFIAPTPSRPRTGAKNDGKEVHAGDRESNPQGYLGVFDKDSRGG